MINKKISLALVKESRNKLSLEEQEVGHVLAISQKQDKSAFEMLYHRYRTRLGTFLFRYLKDKSIVDEVFNDVLMVVWNKADTFNHQSKVSTWIYAIAYRAAIARLRKMKKHLSVVTSDDIDRADEGGSSLETQDFVEKAMNSLSPDHRVVMELAYFEGLNYSEIAQVANCPENTVKTRMFHARKKLQGILKELE